MKVDVIVGCQYGSEGKGMAAGYVAGTKDYDWIVSVNSAQAGHTIPYHVDGKTVYVVTRQLPASCVVNHVANIYIGPGAVINPRVLEEEIIRLQEMNIPITNRLYISKYATVITQDDMNQEVLCGLKDKLGSTCEGVGSALAHRAMRSAKIFNDVTEKDLKQIHEIKIAVDSLFLYGNVLLEGSQGFGLSPFYYYPYCTSRDTTTAAFLSYAQISPFTVDQVYGVYRTRPIRVGGNSGPMYQEMSWDDVANQAGYGKLSEYTTVTKRLRRIGAWDTKLAANATKINGVTKPLITFLNYISKDDERIINYNDLSSQSKEFLNQAKENIGVKIWACSTSRYGDWITSII